MMYDIHRMVQRSAQGLKEKDPKKMKGNRLETSVISNAVDVRRFSPGVPRLCTLVRSTPDAITSISLEAICDTFPCI